MIRRNSARNDVAERHFRTHPAAVDDHHHDGLVVWRADMGGAFRLNTTGATIWRRLRTVASVRDMAAEVAASSGVDELVARGDVERLILSLGDAGLVEPVASESGDPRLVVPTARERITALRFIGSAISPTSAVTIPRDAQGGFWEAVGRIAFRYRVSCLLRTQLERKGSLAMLPNWLHDQLSCLQSIGASQARNARKELEALVAALNRDGIEPMLLKGAAMMSARTYEHDGDRWMTDIDLLLPEEQLRQGVATLQALGFHPAGSPSVDYGRHHHVEPLMRGDDELPIELHRELLPPPWAALLPAARVWSASAAGAHPVLRFRIPSVSHRIAHVIAHAQLVDNHVDRGTLPLRELCDVAWLVHRHAAEIDLPALTSAFAPHGRAFGSFLHLGERMVGMEWGFARSPSLTDRIQWWRAIAEIAWNHGRAANEGLYRLSARAVRKATGCGPGRWSIYRARTRLIGRWLVRGARSLTGSPHDLRESDD